MLISSDRKVVKVVSRNRCVYFKQTRLLNKYILTKDEVIDVFEQSLEVDIVKNRCKVHGLSISRPIVMIKDINTQPMNIISSARWLIGAEDLESAFFTDKCFVVVDRSFFPEYPEFISVY